jgi:hypothetical protein
MLHPNASPREASQIITHLLPKPYTQQTSTIIDQAADLTSSFELDKLIWKWERAGKYTACSIYRVLARSGKIRNGFSFI